MVRFKFLVGDTNWETYGGHFVSQKLNNGDFDYWIVLEVINWVEAVGERDAPAKYNVTLSAISPSEAGEAKLKEAFECCGIDPNDEAAKDDLVKVEALDVYGVKSPLWQANGNNLAKLMKQARREAQCCEGLFGFYMDSPKNLIGSTGWDCIKGDVAAGLRRQEEALS